MLAKKSAKTNKNTTHAKTKTRTVPRELRLAHRNADRGSVSTPEQARKENDVDSVQALPHALRRKRARNGPNMLLHECPQRTLPGSRPRAPPLLRRAPLQGSMPIIHGSRRASGNTDLHTCRSHGPHAQVLDNFSKRSSRATATKPHQMVMHVSACVDHSKASALVE